MRRILLSCMLVATVAAAQSAPAAFSQSLPSETRGWITVPGVIRDDGIDSFRIEVDANGPVRVVRLDSINTSPLEMLVPPPSLQLRDDGLDGDRVAGDFVFTSGPIRYNTAVPMHSHFKDDPDSPAGLWQSQVGVVLIEELDGTTTQFLGHPSIGILRSDVAEASRRELAPNLVVTAHLVNIRTGTRTTQRWMRGLLDSDLSALTKQVYAVLPDMFDFFMFFSTYKVEQLPMRSSANFHRGVQVPVKIDYSGIGLTPRDQTAEWGSAGKLLSVIGLEPYDRGVMTSNATHELMHSWAAYLDDSLGLNDGAHYKVRSSAASLLGGVKWTPNADGSFSIDCDEGRNGAHRAPPLDRYMMGLLDASEVPPLHVYDESISVYERCLTNGPILPSEIVATVSIEDIQAMAGVRMPGPASAQRDFRIAFVAESHGRFLNATELTFYEILAAQYTRTLQQDAADPYVADNWVPITRFFGEDTTWRSDVADTGAALDVVIDFKPYSARNGIDIESLEQVLVAILGSGEFDVLQVDPASVRLGPGEAVPRRHAVKDYNLDGYTDLGLWFGIRDVGLSLGDEQVTLSAGTFDGVSLTGTDAVHTWKHGRAVVQVNIDVQPYSARNGINLASKGTLRVAILSSAVFDALQVDPVSVRLGPGEAIPRRYEVADFNRDGYQDLGVIFQLQEVGLSCRDTTVTLTGETHTGSSISGTDAVKPWNCCRKEDGPDCK